MGALKEVKLSQGVQLKAHTGGGEDHLDFEPSGIGKRFLAYFIDSIILGGILAVVQGGMGLFIKMPDQKQLMAGNIDGGLASLGIILGVTILVNIIAYVSYFTISMKKWSASGKKDLWVKSNSNWQ